MTLLSFLRKDNDFSRSDIIRMLRERRLISEWTAQQCFDFIRRLTNNFGEYSDGAFNTKIRDLAEDLKSTEQIITCHDCDRWEFEDTMIMCYEGDYTICQSCCNNDYVYSDYRDTYVLHDDGDEEDDYYDDNEHDDGSGALDYSHRVEDDLGFLSLPHEKHSKDTIYYGVELEVERRNNCPHDMPYLITDNVLFGIATLKSDGTLDNGFEITTAPATFGKHKKEWEKFFKDKSCMSKLKGWGTDTAGLHIHISRSALSPTSIGKILVFINDDTNSPFIDGIAGRNSKSWAKKSPKKISDFSQRTDKYEAVNLSHRNTIELRIFKSNISKHGFYRVLEFTDALVHFTKNYTGLTGLSLHYKTFLRFMDRQHIKAQYPNLTAWLIRKGYVSGKPSRQVSWQGELNDTATN